MFSRLERITAKEFPAIIKRSIPYHSPLVTMRVVSGLDSPTRFAVVVSSKVAKNAVDRNRLKRRYRHIIKKHLPVTKTGLVVVLFTKNPSLTASSEELRKDLIVLAQKAGIL